MTLEEIIANGDTKEARALAPTLSHLACILATAKAVNARSEAVAAIFREEEKRRGPQFAGRMEARR